ncbi:hypothetical protein [Serratia fonticola]|nr:hypothetical protein [Serratia fonticola]
MSDDIFDFDIDDELAKAEKTRRRRPGKFLKFLRMKKTAKAAKSD